jgi:tRNA(Ile)-lysidine synthase
LTGPPPAAALAGALAAAFADPPRALGVAVSGGGDSVALLVLMAEWAAPRGVALEAATVDHGLRPEAAAEAAAAAALCARLGIPHAVLRWDAGPPLRGNLMDAARRARQRLIGGWAAGRGLAAVALGHTRDDQAETVLMRLGRGAGVDGLSAMAARRAAAGTVWLRPLLAVPRAALRAELSARGIGWAEDPTNDDDRYLRARTRKALARLAPLGIDAAVLAATADRMAAARTVLQAAAQDAARRIARQQGGDVVFDLAGWAALLPETRDRLLGGALRWVGGAEHPPRRAALERLAARIAAGRGGTLAGCAVICRGGELRIAREWRAVRGLVAPVGEVWDGRWRLVAPEDARVEGLAVAALGAEGLAACPGWRAAGLPRASLAVTPAVWHGPWLVAAPLAGLAEGWRAETVPPAADFPAGIILH